MRKKLSFGQIKFMAHQDTDEMRNAIPLRVPRIDMKVWPPKRIGNDVEYMPVWRAIPTWLFSKKVRRAIRDHRVRIARVKTFRRKDGPKKEDFE